MIPRPPRSTRTDTRLPYTALVRSRTRLLEAEKDLTRRRDALAQQRQALPWVRVDKGYRFETEQGQVSLADLFQGRSQLLVYHFMFGPDYKAGCPSCRSEEHTSELQSLMRISYAVFCLKNKRICRL